MADQLGSLIASLITSLQGCLVSLDAEALSGDEAMELFARFAEVERLGAAGKAVTAGRVAATGVWRRGGSRTPADWVARTSGADVSGATETLETAGRLAGCEIVARELRAGALSVAQAHAIVDAAAVVPEAEARLVKLARHGSLRRLREECRRVKNTASCAADDHARLHASRSFRDWIGRDGAVCFSGRVTPDAGAGFLAAVEERKAAHLQVARRDGRREPFEAYAADALVELVTEARGAGAGTGRGGQATQPRATIVVHVAYEALLRGAPVDGEACEIQGVGPVPVAVVRRLAADSILRVLVTRGAQPMAVTPGARTIPRALRLLLEARDRSCVVPGCDVTKGLQVDHRMPFAVLGPTDLDNCALVCKRHHDMKSYLGFVLGWDDDGQRTFRPPDDYLDPEPPDPALGVPAGRDPWTGRPSWDRATAHPRPRNLVGAATSGTAP